MPKSAFQIHKLKSIISPPPPYQPTLYVGFELTPKRDVRRREFHSVRAASVGTSFFLCHNRHKLLLIFRGETNKFATFKRSLVRFEFFQKLLRFVLMANSTFHRVEILFVVDTLFGVQVPAKNITYCTCNVHIAWNVLKIGNVEHFATQDTCACWASWQTGLSPCSRRVVS